MGENEVNRALNNEPFLLYDISLPGINKTQIDHILINRKGIIVIETKNYSGVIRGDSQKTVWTQYIANKRINFLSPIQQNEYHIRQLKSYLKMDHITLYNVVCFSEKAVLNIKSSNFVIHIDDLKTYIDKLPNSNVDEQTIQHIFMSLKPFSKNRTIQ